MRIVGLVFALLFFVCFTISAQTAFRLFDNYDVKARVNSDGILFMNPGSAKPAWEFPSGTGKHLVFSAGLWVGGFDQGGALHMAAQTYRYGESDFWCGPLNSVSGAPFNSSQWDALWGVQKSEIDYHKLNFNQSSYVIPDDILFWPGSSYQGIQQVIAPFADLDQDGVYNPSNGDYPVVQGDDAIYFVFNDMYAAHTQTGGLPLGVEVYAMSWQVNSVDPALRNTVFVRYRIRNRSVFDYSNLRLGIFADFDIGNPFDDHYGTRVDKQMLYAMNGDSLDGSGDAGEYGLYPPAAGVMLLSHDAAHTMSWYNSNQPNGNPSNTIASEYYRLMDGRWRDGSTLSFGGSGYQSSSNAADFIFSGDSDPFFPGQIWNCDSAADHRGLISTGPLLLSAGGYLTFDVAFTCALGLPGQSASLLFTYADRIRAYHQTQVNGIVEARFPKIQMFPNPGSGDLFLRCTEPLSVYGKWNIYDLTGKLVMQGLMESEDVSIDIRDFLSGVYLVTVGAPDGEVFFWEKLVVLD